MGSATFRRFAVVAAVALLAPAWCLPAAVASPGDAHDAVVVGLGSIDTASAASTTPASAVRRPATVAWWAVASRVDHGRGLVALVAAALLSLLGLVRWARSGVPGSAPSPLVRRRHVIALRAPPLPRCA